MNTLELSVVIPVFNEEGSISLLIESLDGALKDRAFEVIAIDDGSTDASADLLEDAARSYPWLRVIRLRRNFGQTAAMQAGFDHAQGAVIVPMDADLQNDPTDIPRLLEKLHEGYDVVSGWRKDRKDASFTRVLPSKIANALVSWISGVRLNDYGCTLKAYRKDVLEDVKIYGEMHRFIPIYAAWEGAAVTELPVNHHSRKFGVSKYGLSRVPRVVLDLLVIRFLDRALDRPIQFFGKIGLYCVLFGLISGLYAIWLKIWQGVSFILTPLPLLTVFLLLIGLLLILLGLLAEVQSRTYFEARGRPIYSIRKDKARSE